VFGDSQSETANVGVELLSTLARDRLERRDTTLRELDRRHDYAIRERVFNSANVTSSGRSRSVLGELRVWSQQLFGIDASSRVVPLAAQG
jgi:hypothetical protein